MISSLLYWNCTKSI